VGFLIGLAGNRHLRITCERRRTTSLLRSPYGELRSPGIEDEADSPTWLNAVPVVAVFVVVVVTSLAFSSLSAFSALSAVSLRALPRPTAPRHDPDPDPRPEEFVLGTWPRDALPPRFPCRPKIFRKKP